MDAAREEADAAEQEAEEETGARVNGSHRNAEGSGPFSGDWMPRAKYTSRYNSDEYDSAATLRQRRGQDPRPRLAVLRAAAPLAAEPATAPSTIAPRDAGVAHSDVDAAHDALDDAAQAGSKRQRLDADGVEDGDFNGVESAALPPPAPLQLVPRPLPVEASASVGAQLSNLGIATSAAVALERREAVAAAAKQGISFAVYSARQAQRRAELARTSPDIDAGVDAGEEEDLGPMRQEEFVQALVDMSEEADELEVAELMDWDTLLDMLGGPHADPLAHCDWADAPARLRVMILYAMLDVRCTRENDGLYTQVTRGGIAPDALRLLQLGADSDGTAYFTFPDGYSEDVPRIYTQVQISTSAHGPVYRWSVAATGVDEVRSLIAARQRVAASLPKSGSKSAQEAELQEHLQQVLQAVTDAAAAAASKAAREARRKRLQEMQPPVKARVATPDISQQPAAPVALPSSIPTPANGPPEDASASATSAATGTGTDAIPAAPVAASSDEVIPEELPLVVTYGENVGVPLLEVQRTRALALIDMMTSAEDVARAVADLLAAAPEHERYIGMPAAPRPLRVVPKSLREATQSEFEVQYEKVRKRRARAMKDRERARKERESAGERQEAAARREEERRKKEEAIAREREARAARRMLGLSVRAAPGFAVDPRRYLPSNIRVPLKVLWRKCDDEVELKRLADLAADNPLTLYDGHGYVRVLGDPQPRDPASGHILPMRVHGFAPESVSDIVATRGETRQWYWDVTQPTELISPPIVYQEPEPQPVDESGEAVPTVVLEPEPVELEDAPDDDLDDIPEGRPDDEDDYEEAPAGRKRSRSRSNRGARRRPSGAAKPRRPSVKAAAPAPLWDAHVTPSTENGVPATDGDVTSSGRKRRAPTKWGPDEDGDVAALDAPAPAPVSRAKSSSGGAKRPRKKARKSSSGGDEVDDAGDDDDSPYVVASARPAARAASRARRAAPRGSAAAQDSLSELLTPVSAPPQYAAPAQPEQVSMAWGNAAVLAAQMQAAQAQQAATMMMMQNAWPGAPLQYSMAPVYAAPAVALSQQGGALGAEGIAPPTSAAAEVAEL